MTRPTGNGSPAITVEIYVLAVKAASYKKPGY